MTLTLASPFIAALPSGLGARRTQSPDEREDALRETGCLLPRDVGSGVSGHSMRGKFFA